MNKEKFILFILAYSNLKKSGTFKGNLTSSDEMVTLVKGKLKEMGIGPVKMWFYTLNIPRLERWKN